MWKCDNPRCICFISLMQIASVPADAPTGCSQVRCWVTNRQSWSLPVPFLNQWDGCFPSYFLPSVLSSSQVAVQGWKEQPSATAKHIQQVRVWLHANYLYSPYLLSEWKEMIWIPPFESLGTIYSGWIPRGAPGSSEQGETRQSSSCNKFARCLCYKINCYKSGYLFRAYLLFMYLFIHSFV